MGDDITTYFIPDFLAVHVSGGIKLLFPLSWGEWQFYLIRSDDYWITINCDISSNHSISTLLFS